MYNHYLTRLFQALDGWFYIALSGRGFYFIYEGDVFQKFNAQRSNFAEYDESVTEFLTIVTYVKTHATMSSNAKFREMGPFSLKIDIKTSGTTFDLIKNASESFWKFGLLTLRPFGLWPLRPSGKFASANGCIIVGCTQNFIKIGQQMTDLHQFLCFSLGLLLSNFKGHLQENRE